MRDGKIIYHPESDTIAFLPICFVELNTGMAALPFEIFDMPNWIFIGDV